MLNITSSKESGRIKHTAVSGIVLNFVSFWQSAAIWDSKIKDRLADRLKFTCFISFAKANSDCIEILPHAAGAAGPDLTMVFSAFSIDHAGDIHPLCAGMRTDNRPLIRHLRLIKGIRIQSQILLDFGCVIHRTFLY